MKSPFKFLDSFDKNDKDIFFGRERETEELYQKIFESKILLVYGISGTGKSSLIHCGLANKFNDSDWLPINIRRVDDINKSLKTSIRQFAAEKLAEEKSLIKYLKSLYLDYFKPIYLIFDQFEELFIFGTESEKKEFIQSIQKITKSDLQVKFLFVIREEYLASITEFEQEIPAILENRIRIEKMRQQNAVSCIEGPCKVNGIAVEEGFAASLLQKLNPNNSEVELTYLQVYLDKVFRISEGNAFSFSLLEQLGSVGDLLGDFLEEQIAQLENPEDAMAILKSFVSQKGTKKPANKEEIISYAKSLGKQIHPDEVELLIQAFVKLRILRDKDQNDRYELRHDALAAKIFEKISGKEKELIEVRHFIENSYEDWKKREVMLTSDDLKYIAPYTDLLVLSEEIQEFYNNCQKYIAARRKSLKQITFISALVFVLITFLLVWFGSNQFRRYIAEDSAMSSLYVYENPYAKLQGAIAAFNEKEVALAHVAFMHAFQGILNLPEGRDTLQSFGYQLAKFKGKSLESNILMAGFIGVSDKIYCYTDDNCLRIWDLNDSLILEQKMPKQIPLHVAFSKDEAYFGLLTSDSLFTLYSIKGDSLFSKKTHFLDVNTGDVFKFINSQNLVALLGVENDYDLWNYSGERYQSFNSHFEPLYSLDVSENDQFIITASADSIVVCYFNKENKTYALYNSFSGPSDTVYSCDFAHNNQYAILTYDRAWYIYSVNGKRLFSSYYSEDSEYPQIFDAEFSDDDNLIFYKSYRNEKDRNSFAYRVRIFYSPKGIANVDVRRGIDKKYKSFVFHKSSLKSACVQNVNANTQFQASKGGLLNLYSFEGQNPEFSSDSEYLLTYKGNQIWLYPINYERLLSHFIKGKH